MSRRDDTLNIAVRGTRPLEWPVSHLPKPRSCREVSREPTRMDRMGWPVIELCAWRLVEYAHYWGSHIENRDWSHVPSSSCRTRPRPGPDLLRWFARGAMKLLSKLPDIVIFPSLVGIRPGRRTVLVVLFVLALLAILTIPQTSQAQGNPPEAPAMSITKPRLPGWITPTCLLMITSASR